MNVNNTKVWLAVAMLTPINFVGEKFYYDTVNKELFIIAGYDYLLLENEDGCFEFQYDDIETMKLMDKLTRLQADDETIVEIPKVPLADRINLQLDFLEVKNQGNSYPQLKAIVMKQEEQHQLILDTVINEEGHFNDVIEDWDRFKFDLLKKMAADFEQAFDLKLEDVTVWKIDKSRAVKKVANKQTVESPTKQEKPWWKFW